jgi:peptide/nickel transport system substrate-binding protein
VSALPREHERKQAVGGILEHVGSRLPTWARGLLRGRILAAVAVAVLVVVLAVSCGGASGESAVPVQTGSPDAGVTGVRAPSSTAGGTLRVAAGEIDSLDPQRSYLPGVWNIMRLYTRTLVTYSIKAGHTGDLVPDLATSLGTTPDQGKTWTFTLREGPAFSIGRAITAKDIKYGIERSFASDVIVGGPTYVVDLLDDPANPYPGPYQDEAKDKLGLKSIETPDDRTITFHLRTADPEFPYVLALPSSGPVPAEADKGAGYGGAPVSSGPYVVAAMDAQTGIRLDRNPHWTRSTDPVRTALPDHVVIRSGLAGIQRDQAVLAGSADVDAWGAGVQPATSSRLADDDTLAGRVDDVTTGALRLLALPTNVAPLDNAACRAAVSEAVDRRALADALGGSGGAVRTSQLWARSLGGGPGAADRRPDLAAARRSLTTCGKPHGFSTVLAVADAPASVELARAVAAQLARVGIKAQVKPLDATTFYATDVGNPDNVAKNGYGIVLATWTADFPTADSFLDPLVDGRSIKKVGNSNYAHLDDAAVNGLIDKARTSESTAAWQAVATAAGKTAAYVPLAETRIQLIAGQRLHNAIVMPAYNGYDLATAGVR